MRMGPDAALDAAVVVNEWDRDDLARILRRYGEERYSGRIADAIIRRGCRQKQDDAATEQHDRCRAALLHPQADVVVDAGHRHHPGF